LQTNEENGMSIRDMNHDPLTEYPHLLHTLAFHAAVKIVKHQIAARGDKLREFSRKEIHIEAEAYFEANRECLMVETFLKIQREPSLLRLAEGEAKRRARDRVKPMEPRRALQLIQKMRKG
jgi:hypothetical protein